LLFVFLERFAMRAASPDTASPPPRRREALGIVLFALMAAVGVTLLHVWLLGP
jgi:hypothetical protein